MVYTLPTKKVCIIHFKNIGMTNDAIAEKFHIHRTTVARIYHQHSKFEDYYHVKPKPGRLCKFITHNVCFAARTLANCKAHDVTDLQRQYFPGLHSETIRQRLATCGLKAYVCRKRPFLLQKHKNRRLKWAKAHQHWTANDWKAVIFSNESKFNLFRSDGCCWCWRKPGEQFNDHYVRKEVKHNGGNIMVWGCVTAEGLSQLCCIQGNMDAKLYVSILDDNVLDILKDLEINKKDIYFQQDNVPKHTSRLAQDWFNCKKLDVLDWPTSRPNTNIIKHVWKYLNWRVHTQNPLLRNHKDMWAMLQKEWGQIEMDYIEKLFQSMPERVDMLVKAKGGYTWY